MFLQKLHLRSLAGLWLRSRVLPVHFGRKISQGRQINFQGRRVDQAFQKILCVKFYSRH